MRETKPNRARRRHPETLERPEDEPIGRSTDVQPDDQEVTDVRAKSSGHGKRTADKWNQ